MRSLKLACLLPLLACVGCANTLQPQDFKDQTPEIRPMQFFTGHTHSWGIVETGSGEPRERFETDAVGYVDADGALHWPQRLTFDDGTVQERDWVLRQTGEHTYEGTANDIAGTAHAEAYGNLFHLTFTLETTPGNSLMCSMRELTFAHIEKKETKTAGTKPRKKKAETEQEREENSRDKAEKGESVAEPRLDLLPTIFFLRFFRFQLPDHRHLIGSRTTFASNNLLHQSHRQLFQGHRKQLLRHPKLDIQKLDIKKPEITTFGND